MAHRGQHTDTRRLAWKVIADLSDFPRVVSSPTGRVSNPRPSGDQGIDPTPNICGLWVGTQGERARGKRIADLERGEHLTLLLAVEETVVVLHRDERGEAKGDRVVYESYVSRTSMTWIWRQDLLCIW